MIIKKYFFVLSALLLASMSGTTFGMIPSKTTPSWKTAVKNEVAKRGSATPAQFKSKGFSDDLALLNSVLNEIVPSYTKALNMVLNSPIYASYRQVIDSALKAFNAQVWDKAVINNFKHMKPLDLYNEFQSDLAKWEKQFLSE